MDIEDEILEELESLERTIVSKEKLIEEQDKTIGEKDKTIREKNLIIDEKVNAIQNTIKNLRKKGMSDNEIAELTGLNLNMIMAILS